MAGNLTNSLIRHLPDAWVGLVHFHLKPTVLDGFGVFNGQCFRQLIFIDLHNACHFQAVVETGTYVGCTTQFMAKNSRVPVYTVENSPRFFHIAKRHLKNLANVHLALGDSVSFLRSLPFSAETRIFFYLDAHWWKHLPLREETELIFSRYRDFVVMIDDFAVPSDDDYTYDDYGPGKQLALRDFPYHTDSRVSAYFPSRPASEESGERRGSIILASASMTRAVDSLACLTRVDGTAAKPVR